MAVTRYRPSVRVKEDENDRPHTSAHRFATVVFDAISDPDNIDLVALTKAANDYLDAVKETTPPLLAKARAVAYAVIDRLGWTTASTLQAWSRPASPLYGPANPALEDNAEIVPLWPLYGPAMMHDHPTHYTSTGSPNYRNCGSLLTTTRKIN